MSGIGVSTINPMLKKVREEQEKKTLKMKNKDENKRRFSKLRQRIKEKTNKTGN